MWLQSLLTLPNSIVICASSHFTSRLSTFFSTAKALPSRVVGTVSVPMLFGYRGGQVGRYSIQMSEFKSGRFWHFRVWYTVRSCTSLTPRNGPWLLGQAWSLLGLQSVADSIWAAAVLGVRGLPVVCFAETNFRLVLRHQHGSRETMCDSGDRFFVYLCLAVVQSAPS